MKSRNDKNEELAPHGRETITFEQGGVDEVSVVPWTQMIPRQLARKVGLTKKWATLFVVLAGLCTTSVTITILVVSLETIAKDLDSSASVLNWSITGPMLAFGVVGPAYGKIGDLYGHKKVYVFGLLFAGIFAFLTAFAWNATSMVVFRLLSATAGSATGPAAMAYVNRLFEPNERVRPLGLWSFVTAGAPVLGVVIGGPVISAIGWRMIFIVQAPLLLGAALLAWNLLPQTTRSKNVKFDVKGSVTLGVGATLFLLTINRGHSWGWTSPAIIIFGVISVLSLWMFIRTERVAEAPLMPLHWLRTPNIILPIVIQSLINFAYMGGFIVVPQMLERGLGFSSSHVGWLIVARPLTFSITAPLASFFTMRAGERKSGVIGACAVIASMLILSGLTSGSSDLLIVTGLGLSGIGFGIAAPALTALVANAVDDETIGVAGAMQQLLSQMGAVLGSTVMISVHEMTVSSTSVVRSYGIALLFGAGTATAAALIATRLTPTDRSVDAIANA
ncbi:MAG: MFS transporter [Ilumatobacteraceae bacterium]|nr:MFS transporter [Ilumatobacteraceae bacterium]